MVTWLEHGYPMPIFSFGVGHITKNCRFYSDPQMDSGTVSNTFLWGSTFNVDFLTQMVASS